MSPGLERAERADLVVVPALAVAGIPTAGGGLERLRMVLMGTVLVGRMRC
jgi:hypothetical protein